MGYPELTASIEAGPGGPEIGAFFDFDGTLISGYSALVLGQQRMRRREITPGEMLRSIRAGLEFGLGRADFGRLAAQLAEAWKGRVEDDLGEMGERLFVERLAALVYPESRALVMAHMRRGHTVVLATSATIYQAGALARDMGIEHVLCTRLEVENGLVTGRIVEPHLWGEGKQHAVEKFAAEQGIDLACSYAYANGDEDVKLLEIVGNPRPVNPTRALAAVATRNDWPIHRFTSRGRVTPATVARNVLGASSMVTSIAVGAGLAAVNRRKADLVNTVGSVGSSLSLGATGVRVSVTGAEHLWAQRPAAFILNHQSALDPIIVMHLVGQDFTGVAKRELGRNPIFRLLMNLADGVLVDRSNTQEAVAALGPLVRQAIEHGKSIIIAPEGTRSPTPTLGRFKKGAFRIAMAAEVPIVPVVIRNSHDVMPKTSLVVRPGVVDVAVLPPISVADWTLDNLDARIAEVRRLYLDTLTDWPGERHEPEPEPSEAAASHDG